MTALNVGDRVVVTAEKTDRLGFLSACKGTVIEKQTVQFDDETAVAIDDCPSFYFIPTELLSPCEDTKKPASHQSEDFMFFEVLLDSAEDAHPGSKQFYNLLIEAGLLHAQKQRDYGRSDDPFANVRASEDFGIAGWVGCMIRANDKMRRLQTYAKSGTLANEGVRDSLLDLAVYALIGLVLFEELA
jgi:hypothetical protein